MKHRFVLVSVIAALCLAVCALCACSGSQISVKVVDKAVATTTGEGASGESITTAYTYNDKGQLTSTEESSDGSSASLKKMAFTYNDKGQLTKVESSFKDYNWGVGYRETFEYTFDKTNFCTTYGTEVVSQGMGTTSTAYTMNEKGLPSASVRAIHSPADPATITQATALTYLDSGHICVVLSDTPGGSCGIDDTATNEDEGTYVYKTDTNAVITLKFDKDGNLTSAQTTTSTTISTVTYTYKDIKVDKSSYVPSIFSNPQGFSTEVMPSLSKAVVDKIMGN